MPAYVAEPGTQTYPPKTIAAVQTSIPCYSWGSYTPYADAPSLDVEHAELIPDNGTAGRQFATRAFSGLNQNSPAVTWETTYGGTSVGAIDIRLQGAIRDEASDYFDLDKSTNASGEARTVNLGSMRVNFLRILIVTSTNTDGTVIAKFIL